MPRTLSSLLCLRVLLAGQAACGGGGDSPSGPQRPGAIGDRLSGTATLTAAGQTTTLAAQVRLSTGTVGTQSPMWTSRIRPWRPVRRRRHRRASGQATISAAVGAITGSASVTVAIPTVQTITVTPPRDAHGWADRSARRGSTPPNGAVGSQAPSWTSSAPPSRRVGGGRGDGGRLRFHYRHRDDRRDHRFATITVAIPSCRR